MNQDVLFQGFSDEQIAIIKSFCFKADFTEDQVIMQDEQPGEDMVILEYGYVAVSIAGNMIELPERAVFGEVVLFEDQGVRTATIVAKSLCTASILTKNQLRKLKTQHPRLMIHLMQNICTIFGQRLRSANDNYRELRKDFFELRQAYKKLEQDKPTPEPETAGLLESITRRLGIGIH